MELVCSLPCRPTTARDFGKPGCIMTAAGTDHTEDPIEQLQGAEPLLRKQITNRRILVQLRLELQAIFREQRLRVGVSPNNYRMPDRRRDGG